MNTKNHTGRGETSMAIASSPIEILGTRRIDVRSEGRALESAPGLAIMRPLRRAAILLLDMRTEFEVLTPGDPAPVARDSGLMAVAGLAIARKVRQVASTILDPWAEFETLD
jgi:hypothetical protein